MDLNGPWPFEPPVASMFRLWRFLVLFCVMRTHGTAVLAGCSWSPPPLELVNRPVADDLASSTGCEWGDKAADESRALTPVSVGDGSVLGVVYLSKASPMQSPFAHSCCSRRNPYLSIIDRMTMMLWRRSTF
jgi:hypothetical protein